MDKEKLDLLIEAENTVIAGLVYGKEKIYYQFIDYLSEKIFYNRNPKNVFKAVQEIVNYGDIVDPFTVKARLKNGSHQYINELRESYTQDNDDIKSRIDFLNDNWRRQSVIEILIEATTKISEDSPVDEITAKLISGLNNLDRVDRKLIKINEAVYSVIEGINTRLTNPNAFTGIPTGLTDFDLFSNGFQPGDLVIIAGETSQGKTALAVTVAKNQSVDYQRPSLFISIEMTDTQLAGRMMSQETGISSKVLLSGRPSMGQLQHINNTISKLINANIYIDNSASTDINEIVGVIHTTVAKFNIEVVYIDYLQLVSMKTQKGATKEQEVADICRLLKNTAKKLNIPIVLLSQLNRDRANPKPSLARLRGSGQIEEAADIVWFIWRPEYYGFEYIEMANGSMTPSVNAAHGIIAKGRNIGITEFLLSWNKEKTEFSDYSVNATPQPIPQDYPDVDANIEPNKNFDNTNDIPF